MKKFPLQLWLDVFTELAWLLRHGISLQPALQLLLKQRRLKPLHAFLYHCLHCITQGQPLSAALAISPQSSLFQAFVICGEKSGALEQGLSQCIEWLTQTLQFQTQCRSLAFYPVLLGLVLITGSALLIGVIVPQFYALYETFHAPIPTTLQWMWSTHLVLITWGIPCLLGMILFAFVITMGWRLFPTMKHHVQSCLFRMPAMKFLCHAHECAHLGTLLNGGVPLCDALNMVIQHSRFSVHQQIMGRLMEAISQGTALTEAYRIVNWHDAYLCDMLNIAEHTGTLDIAYLKCYHYYHAQLEDRLKRFKQEWQPLILLGMGLFIGAWVLLLYYPLIQLGYVVG